MASDSAGKVALVTGAGVRLGRAIALGLAERGCDLVLHCNRSKRGANEVAAEIRQLGRQAKVIAADLSKVTQVRKLAREAQKAFGRVDVLINSAAIFWPSPPETLTGSELDPFLDVNLKAPYILTCVLGAAMKKRGGGAVVNIACVSALRAWTDYVPYSISKAGLAAMTVGMAKALGPEVRVNAIAPGTVLPPHDMDKKAVAAEAKRVPLKSVGAPADIVGAALYLLEAPFVTGQILCVDGGLSIA